jgi:hypothetical protein
LRRILTLLSFFLLATQALALPAPMSEGELLEKSDVVAVIRVLSVSSTAVTKDDQTGEVLPSYLARARLLEVKKGDVKQGDEILITWRAIPKGIVGPWTVNYYPGEVVLTHLIKKTGGATFGSTWWNAKGDDIKAPASTELPTSIGETFDAPKGDTDEHPL